MKNKTFRGFDKKSRKNSIYDNTTLQNAHFQIAFCRKMEKTE